MICKKRGVRSYRIIHIDESVLWCLPSKLKIAYNFTLYESETKDCKYTHHTNQTGDLKKWHFSWLKINSLVDTYHSCQAPSQLMAISHHQQPVNHDKPNDITIKHVRMKTWTKYDLLNSRVKMWISKKRSTNLFAYKLKMRKKLEINRHWNVCVIKINLEATYIWK